MRSRPGEGWESEMEGGVESGIAAEGAEGVRGELIIGLMYGVGLFSRPFGNRAEMAATRHQREKSYIGRT